MYTALFIYILIIHYLGDFALQTSDQALNKSSNNIYLLRHVAVYSFVWLLFSIVFVGYVGIWGVILFVSITFITHFCIDYVTSRIVKSFFEKKDYHNAFVVIGMDQILHYIQLWFTFNLLLP